VISELCAGLVGGLAACRGNIGEAARLRGGARQRPDLAGKDVANPLAILMSSVMMLNHLSLDAQRRIGEESLDADLATPTTPA